MRLSIIVPTLDQNRFIGETLDSILAQDYRPLEIIVVDGGSTDGTTDTLRRYAARHPCLRWISEKDNGPADAVNKGLAMASGEIAAIQSSDDLYRPGAFPAVAEAFRTNPTCGLAIGDTEGIDADGVVRYVEVMPEFSWEAYFARSLQIYQSSIFFRVDLARAAGGWNGKYYGCDLDFWMRLLLRTRPIKVGRVLSAYRIYGASQRTYRRDAVEKIWSGYWQMIEDSADLRRAPARVRRLARASRHLFAMRFHPSGNPWIVRLHLVQGLLLHPTFWRHYRWDLARWVPGVTRLRRLAGRRDPHSPSGQ